MAKSKEPAVKLSAFQKALLLNLQSGGVLRHCGSHAAQELIANGLLEKATDNGAAIYVPTAKAAKLLA